MSPFGVIGYIFRKMASFSSFQMVKNRLVFAMLLDFFSDYLLSLGHLRLIEVVQRLDSANEQLVELLQLQLKLLDFHT